MADTKISALTASTTPLAGTEVLPIVQSGTTVKVSVANLTAGRAVTMLSNTMISASALNDVDKTGGASYGYRIRGNDQAHVRFRFENSSGRTWELIGGYAGANNTYFSIFDVTGSRTPFSIDDNGNVRADIGNLVIDTAGKGITLPGGITWTSGSGSPEGVVTAPVGSLYSRSDGGLLTSLYVKESGAGNTGWIGK